MDNSEFKVGDKVFLANPVYNENKWNIGFDPYEVLIIARDASNSYEIKYRIVNAECGEHAPIDEIVSEYDIFPTKEAVVKFEREAIMDIIELLKKEFIDSLNKHYYVDEDNYIRFEDCCERLGLNYKFNIEISGKGVK